MDDLDLGTKIVLHTTIQGSLSCTVTKISNTVTTQKIFGMGDNPENIMYTTTDLVVQADNDGEVYHISDAFGMNSDCWARQEVCCEQCEFSSRVGGDRVPYGSGWATLPEGLECDCPDIPESIEDPYEATNGGNTCLNFKRSY